MAACRAALRDALAPPTAGVSLDQANPLLLAQLDRPQVAAVALLQLLRHAAVGDCGALRLLHSDDWPELRLAQAAASAAGAPSASTLPTLCAARGVEQPALIDYRCHALALPNGSSAVVPFLPPPFRACLAELAGEQSSAAPGDAPSQELVRLLGGEARPGARAALARRASLLLEHGMAEALRDAGAATPAGPAACCTGRGCARVSCGRPANDAGEPAEGELLHVATPRRPRAIGAAACGDGALGDRSRRVDDADYAVPDDDAALRAAAMAHMADGAALLPSRFDSRYTNPCWACNLSAVRSGEPPCSNAVLELTLSRVRGVRIG
eukprot:514334-Prymnesium_polylepis.1